MELSFRDRLKQIIKETYLYNKVSINENYHIDNSMLEEAEYRGRKVTLNKPFRNNDKSSSKKFVVYTKNDKGNVVKVLFGAKGYKIKRNIPGYKKKYRKRHGCDTSRRGPKWKANYWSCQWGWGNKNLTAEDYVPGGKGDNKSLFDVMKIHNMETTDENVDNIMKEFIMGLQVEMEHTDDINVAKEIAIDHLSENPEYYTKLKDCGLADELNEANHQIIGFDKVVNYVYDEIMNNWGEDGYFIMISDKEELYNLLPINAIEIYFNNENKFSVEIGNEVSNKIYKLNLPINKNNMSNYFIKSSIEHELKHIYDNTKKPINTDDKYIKFINLSKKYSNYYFIPYILYFLYKFEQSASLQQFYTTLKDIKINNTEDFLKILKSTQMFNIISKVENFNFDEDSEEYNNLMNELMLIYNKKDLKEFKTYIKNKITKELSNFKKKLLKTVMNHVS